MKVLMFGWEFPPFISGGLGTACYGITKGLCTHGVKVDFVLPKVNYKEKVDMPINIIDASTVKVKYRYMSEKEFKDQLRFIEVNSSLKAYMTEESYKSNLQNIYKNHKEAVEGGGTTFQFAGGYGDDLMQEVFRLKAVGYQLGLETDAEVIHAHDWMTFPAAIAAKQASKLPLIVHVHATEFDRSSTSVNQAVYDLEREGMHAADMIIAVSSRTRDLLVKHYGVDSDKVRVVYNAVDKTEIDFTEMPKKAFNEFVVLFLGRITSQKGPAYFLETARIVLNKHDNVRFVMAGSGDILPDMIRLCAKMRLQNKFHFTGFLRGKELEHIFSMSDLLVMPSVSEPFGIVPIEAIQFNLPVIISKQSGVAEILPHAIKVDFWDVELFAKSIIDLIDNPKLRKKQIEGNHLTLQNVHWDLSALEILDLYKKVVYR